MAALERGGYGALTARVLSARGCETAEQAEALLRTDSPLEEPLLLREMDRAVAAIEQALRDGTRIAVFGDYDVDGITATCLLTDYLRSRGGDCTYHIPGRLEEGYGLNAGAIRELAAQGVGLIVSVDCGITALEEAQLCRELGVRLVITDHHECKPTLPQADAVIDPHRPDRTYPHTDLSGVGVAFKLAAALEGDQDAAARRYCDLVCLGTVADVMPLRGREPAAGRDGACGSAAAAPARSARADRGLLVQRAADHGGHDRLCARAAHQRRRAHGARRACRAALPRTTRRRRRSWLRRSAA